MTLPAPRDEYDFVGLRMLDIAQAGGLGERGRPLPSLDFADFCSGRCRKICRYARPLRARPLLERRADGAGRPLSSNPDHPICGLQRWTRTPRSVRFSQKSHSEAALLKIDFVPRFRSPTDGT